MAHPHFAPRALTGWIAALVLCLAVYLAIAKSGPWHSAARDLHIPPSSMRLARGTGALAGGALVVGASAQDGNAVISVATNFAARDYSRVAWQVRGLPEGIEVALLWNTDIEPDRVNRLPLSATDGALRPVDVASDRHWLGHIRGLALVLHGELRQPVAILGAEAGTGDALDTLRTQWREWFGYGPWNGTSINTAPGGADIQLLPLPLLLVAAFLVAVAATGARAAWRRRTQSVDSTAFPVSTRFRSDAGFSESVTIPVQAVSFAHSAWLTSIAPTALLLFLASWFVLDLRWQVTLARHVYDDGLRFAGKTSAEKHLALDDAALFAFTEKVRAILPPLAPDAPDASGARVFVLADSNYLRGRAAYQLYPWNVWSDATRNVVPPADRLRRGDWIVVYQRRGVEYDAATHHLRWDGGTVLDADLKLLDHGGALFELR